MQSHNRLFSYKQIVGISLFLGVIILFIFTGFQFSISMPSFNLPNLGVPNPFESYCEKISPNKQPYCALADTLDLNHFPEQIKDYIFLVKQTLCEDLPSLLETNTKWDPQLRAYVAYRIINECP